MPVSLPRRWYLSTRKVAQCFLILLIASALPAVAESQTCEIDINLVAELGRVDDPTSVIEPYGVHVARLPDGGWLVTGAGRQVVGYARDGSFQGYPVREGEGPLELRAAVRVAVDPMDSVWVSGPQGRAVILGPDGVPARTLTNPAFRPAERFTPGGLPFAVYVRPSPEHTIEEPAMFGGAWVFSRQGDSLWTAGYGGLASAPEVRPVALVPHRSVAAVADTVFLGWSSNDWSAWVTRWTPGGAAHFVRGDAAWQALGLGQTAPRFHEGSAVDVWVGDDGAVWVLAQVRRRSRGEEESMRERVAEAMDEWPGSADVAFRPEIMNAVFDGALLRVASADDGAITAATLFGEYPWRFIDEDHFFTMSEDATGLIKIRVWRFEPRCE